MSSLVQGTEEWLQFRRSRVGSSESASLMGVCPYSNAFDLYQKKMGLVREGYVNDAMKEGTRKEPIARAWYNDKTGEFFAPRVMVHAIYPRIHSSLDGITFDGQRAIEIKCPTLEVYHQIVKCGIPDNYFCQCQHHLLVTGVDEIEFFVWLSETENHTIIVQRDETYILKLIDVILEFLECLDNKTPPKKTKRKGKLDYEDTSDSRYISLVEQIREAKKRIAMDEEIESKARSELLRLSEGRNIRGDGFQIYYSNVDGPIDYARVPQLKGIDLEAYRKPSYQKATIKVEL